MTRVFGVLAVLLIASPARAQVLGCGPQDLNEVLSPACVPAEGSPCRDELHWVRQAETDCLYQMERLLAEKLPSEAEMILVANGLDRLLEASRLGTYGYRAGFSPSAPAKLREAQKRIAGPSPKGDPYCRAGFVRKREAFACDGASAVACAAELTRMEHACDYAYKRARKQWKLAAQGKAPSPITELEGILDNARALRDATLRHPGYPYGLSVTDVESDLAAVRILQYKEAPQAPESHEIRSEALRTPPLAVAPLPTPAPAKPWTPIGWIAGILIMFAAASALFVSGRKDAANAPAEPLTPPTPGTAPGPGDLVAERYLVKEELRATADPGWIAIDRMTGETVVLRGPGHGAAFEDEAHRASALTHPGAVRVRGSARDPRGLFVISDQIIGETLAAKCAAHGPFEVDFVKRILTQACGTLSAAHSLGLMHGGICAERLVLDHDATLKITGFGPMRSSVGFDAAAPDTTPSVSGDLYALACTIYLLLFKVQPFAGPNPAARKAACDFVSATNRKPGLPLALDLFFTRALSPKPERRYHSADEFLFDFEQAVKKK